MSSSVPSSDDILRRLRDRQKRSGGRAKMELWRLMRDAIAEIERLRRELDLPQSDQK